MIFSVMREFGTSLERRREALNGEDAADLFGYRPGPGALAEMRT